MNSSHDLDAYYVDLHVGQDASGLSCEHEQLVSTLVSRQMLCDMTANIEYNAWMLNRKESLSDRERKMRDGVRYRNLNYLISGVRGSGKTTFLNSLIRSLTREIDPFSCSEKYPRYTAEHYIGCSRKDVVCRLLHRYDPSCPGASHSSFLISVVAAMQSLLEKQQKTARAGYEDCSIAEMECRRVLKLLDKGISRISRTDTPLKDLSEHEANNLRVEDAVLEEQIRSNFHRALESLCRICHVDAFIVAIDDADTRFSHCASVIEDLRLYMSHSRLIVLLAGDRDLYLERIREFHFKEYDKEYHQADAKGIEYRMDFVMNHASQYMIKLFPLENQYELRDVAYLSRKLHPIRCCLKTVLHLDGKATPEQMELTVFVNQVLKAVINSDMPEMEHYVNLFLSMPLRTLLQVVNAWVLDDVWANLVRIENIGGEIDRILCNRENNKADVDYEKIKELVVKRDNHKKYLRNIVKNTLYAAWESEIRVSDYQFDKIELDDPRGFFPLMLRLCIHMNDVDHGFFLSGDAGSSLSDQRVMMLLALASGNHLNNLEDVLSYLLFGPATVALFAKAVEQDRWEKKERRPGAKEELSDLFFRYFQVSNRISPTRWARQANMLWGFDPGREGLHTGVLRLRYTEMVDALDSAVFSQKRNQQGKSISDSERLRKIVAFLGSMGHSEARDNSYFLSIFGLLGFILKCLQCCRQCQEKQIGRTPQSKEEDLEKQTIQELSRLIYESAPIKSCRDPEWLMSWQRHEGFNETTLNIQRDIFFDGSGGKQYSQALLEIATDIYQWYQGGSLAEAYIVDDDISAQKMGDLWANLYYHLKGICYSCTGARMKTRMTVPGVSALKQQIGKMVDSYQQIFMMDTSSDGGNQKSNHRSPEIVAGLTRSQYYRAEIGRFPLMQPFCEGCRNFAEKLGEIEDDLRQKEAAEMLRRSGDSSNKDNCTIVFQMVPPNTEVQ